MNYIGEFQKDSTILLELLTKDEENQPIPADFAPTATIEHYGRNGIVVVDNVTLETMGDGSRHTCIYQIPVDFSYGDYLITYHVSIDGIDYSTQEKFYISRNEELAEENNQLNHEILELIRSQGDPLKKASSDEAASNEEGYITPPDFQIPSMVKVVDNRLIITLSEPAKYNHTYRVVLDKSIRSLDGSRLGATKTITFTSEYKPLFATTLEVQSILRSTYRHFTPHDIYAAIRDAGQKAHQLLRLNPDPNNSRFRAMRQTDPVVYSVGKYATYEASRMLMTSLMVRILNGAHDEEAEPGLGMINQSGGSIKLGDFQVSDASSSESGFGGGSNTKKEETPLEKLQVLIREVEKELKFWKDAMMGHNRRGYAKPVTGSYRSGAGSPEGRDFR